MKYFFWGFKLIINIINNLKYLNIFLITSYCFANTGQIVLKSAPINLKDEASLQRGVKYYMNFCAACHSAQYIRYSRLAEDIKLTDTDNQILTDEIKTNLMFNTTDINSQIKNGMLKKDAEKWFGVAPPDLTMVTRVRGQDWVYNYLKSFYIDKSRPWGVNNLVFKDVAMPNILAEYQGEQILDKGLLKIVKPGIYNEQQFDIMIADITNFLSYASEPYRANRIYIGIWVMLFLSVFLIFAYLMKREYWRDIKDVDK